MLSRAKMFRNETISHGGGAKIEVTQPLTESTGWPSGNILEFRAGLPGFLVRKKIYIVWGGKCLKGLDGTTPLIKIENSKR